MICKSFALIGAAFLMTSPIFADTYYGGFEDVTHHGDLDYNDLVFSMSGTGLTLHTSTGQWFAKPDMSNIGSPFWNNTSLDGPKENIGYCVYGGGNCDGGVALDANANYLATGQGGIVNDVYFTTPGSLDGDVDLHIASDKDLIGYYLLSDSKHTIHYLNSTQNMTGDFSFTPGGSFGLAATNMTPHVGGTYYSQSKWDCGCGGTDPSDFAFFSSTAPEPGMTSLIAGGLVGVGLLFRRRKAKTVTV